MRNNVAVMMAALALGGGCSFGMKSLDPKYDGSTEPQCDDGYGTIVLDAIGGGLLLGMAFAAYEDDQKAQLGLGQSSDLDAAAIVIGSIAGGIYAISGAVGEASRKKCEAAKTAWAMGTAAAAGAKRVRDVEVERPAPPPAPVVVATPRGWYCTTSPTVETADMCMREKDACMQARDAAAGAVADLTDCALVEHAYCVQTGPGRAKCSATVERCNVMRERIAAADSTVIPVCEER